ncbi:carbamoyltransferase HypF [Niveibacterium microcysteis]|uniref:Carbamoyltransferase HypF n=1 Tax=Niveibacterium microcysteis TaxID=2811415 RepID=A0ABX7M8C8_9RHOO|nr:carbamoyltransferase HypF [Niveibacterium microcysteis]QSI77993.1 carbamoyltransferase HypF [Niveibacterium microcysteis]
MIRRRLRVTGIVQGVGFRPFTHRLAHALQLSGWVRNDASGVTIEVQGDAPALDAFAARLRTDAPSSAQIDTLEVEPCERLGDGAGFQILDSEAGGTQRATIGPDLCICPACLAELFDPANRRYRYAFINCTDCGPRYTIAARLPYDRANTSMARFAQCPACLAEYRAPGDRRFHAEPNACPSCGPRLGFFRAADDGKALPVSPTVDPVAEALAHLRRGDVVAIKGLGGFHLACDARNASAVEKLRTRKNREEKPLAVMVANLASLSEFAAFGATEAAALNDVARPIVLLPKRGDTDARLPGVAPGLGWLGAMLPYTPLQYLLFHEAAGRPSGTDWLAEPQPLTLVMTSANPHGEPLITDDDEALERLRGIADAWLLHDREILIRCDDSVVRPLAGQATPQFLRRARGYTPRAIPLAAAASRHDVLALGGFFKNTLCLTRGDQAFLSQHIGDLDRVANCRALEAAVDHLTGLLQVKPEALAHDLHPDFFSTRLALQLAERWQVPALGVQHHHAHIAAVLAEHKRDAPVLGLALDGVGFGTDGQPWGGELLRVDGAQFERLGHLRPLPMLGGDRAAREPWRMGAAALALLGRQDEITTRFAKEPGAAAVAQMLRGHAPTTTSMGRWFDAAAGLLGIQPRMSFEGQAAMRLEGLAQAVGPLRLAAPLHRIDTVAGRMQLDLSPALAELSEMADVKQAAALFHAALIYALADWVGAAAESQGIRTVVCAGGCFLNAILALGLRSALQHRGLTMLEAQAAPPGDGGLALGQAWVARRMIEQPGAWKNPGF